jgi:hypothetical protein
MAWLFLGVVIFLAPLSGQSLSWENSTDVAITPQMVVGDYWTLTISGAAANAAIVLQYTENGGSTQYFTLADTTDGSGNYSGSAQVSNASLATWTNTWYVGGVQLGPTYDYAVIRLPSQLGVAITSHSDCAGSYPYGVVGSIDYDIEDSGGNLVASSNIILYPYFAWNGGGAVAVASASTGANSYGVFTYSPIFLCSTATFSSMLYGSEILYVKIGSSTIYDQVRSQSWYASSSGYQHGDLTNTTDITITD